MTDGDITWEQMWAEEERQRQAAAASAWRTEDWGQQVPLGGLVGGSEAEPGLALAPEPYFGGQSPHHPEPQPYFEYSADPVQTEAEAQPPALRVTLPPAAPSRPKLRDLDDEPVEGLDELDWQAPPPPVNEPPREPQPSPQDREWESTWADGIHKPRHAK